jgi:hypothetical protein
MMFAFQSHKENGGHLWYTYHSYLVMSFPCPVVVTTTARVLIVRCDQMAGYKLPPEDI